MMIFQGSRYTTTKLMEGQVPRTLALRRIPDTRGVIEHIVMEGERLDHLAARFYGDAEKYWLILDANPDELDPFELLEPGRRIRIPQNRMVTR
jgi:nucleoid-associated protein YgaU